MTFFSLSAADVCPTEVLEMTRNNEKYHLINQMKTNEEKVIKTTTQVTDKRIT